MSGAVPRMNGILTLHGSGGHMTARAYRHLLTMFNLFGSDGPRAFYVTFGSENAEG